MDKTVGNSGGMGGIFGPLYAIGKKNQKIIEFNMSCTFINLFVQRNYSSVW